MVHVYYLQQSFDFSYQHIKLSRIFNKTLINKITLIKLTYLPKKIPMTCQKDLTRGYFCAELAVQSNWRR